MKKLTFKYNVFDGKRQDGLPCGCPQVQCIEYAFDLVVIACGGEVFRKNDSSHQCFGKSHLVSDACYIKHV